MYTPEDSPFEKFRTEKLKGVAMSTDVLELVAKAYEVGFIDGMQKQMQSSVDRAVNRMANAHLAMQVRPSEFAQIIKGKESATGVPAYWAEWPNKEQP